MFVLIVYVEKYDSLDDGSDNDWMFWILFPDIEPVSE